LPGFVVELDDDVLAEVPQRHLGPEPRAEVPDLVRPLLEFLVVRDSALERDGIELRAAGRLARRRRVAALTVLHHFGGPLERRHLADARDIAPVPLHAELEVLI